MLLRRRRLDKLASCVSEIVQLYDAAAAGQGEVGALESAMQRVVPVFHHPCFPLNSSPGGISQVMKVAPPPPEVIAALAMEFGEGELLDFPPEPKDESDEKSSENEATEEEATEEEEEDDDDDDKGEADEAEAAEGRVEVQEAEAEEAEEAEGTAEVEEVEAEEVDAYRSVPT